MDVPLANEFNPFCNKQICRTISCSPDQSSNYETKYKYECTYLGHAKRQIQADTIRYNQIQADTTRYDQIRPDTNRYKQIQLIKAKFK